MSLAASADALSAASALSKRPRGGASKSASLSTMAFDLADGAGRGRARPPGTYGDVKCGVNTSRRAFRRAVPCSRECKRVAPRGSLCEVARDALIPPQAESDKAFTLAFRMKVTAPWRASMRGLQNASRARSRVATD